MSIFQRPLDVFYRDCRVKSIHQLTERDFVNYCIVLSKKLVNCWHILQKQWKHFLLTSLFTENYKLDLILTLTHWSCDDECQYECMWKTVEAFKRRSWPVPQFFGKVGPSHHVTCAVLKLAESTLRDWSLAMSSFDDILVAVHQIHGLAGTGLRGLLLIQLVR